MTALSSEVQKLVDTAVNSAFLHKKDNDGNLYCIQLFTGSNGLQSITSIHYENELMALSELFGGVCNHTLLYITDTWSLSPLVLKEDPSLALQAAMGLLNLGEIYSDPSHRLNKWVTECLVITGSYDDGAEEFVVRVPYTTYEGEYFAGDQVMEDPKFNNILKQIHSGRESFPMPVEDRSEWSGYELLSAQIFAHIAAAQAAAVLIEIMGSDHCEQLWEAVTDMIEKIEERAKEKDPEATFKGRLQVASKEGVFAGYPNE